MPHSLHISSSGTTILAALKGEVDKDEYLAARQRVVAEVGKAGSSGILLDLRQARLKISTLDVFAVASTTASVIPPGTKYAIVVSAETLESNDVKFGENVATNRGASLRVFEDEASARSWLSHAG